MATEIIVSEDEYEARAALLEEGRLVEFYLERKDTEQILGNIYKGRVASVLPGMQAAFVDIGTGKNAFLHISDLQTHVNEFGEIERNVDPSGRHNRIPIEQILKKGQEILVQIDKEPIGTKGPRVTGYLTIPGRYLVFVPTATSLGISRRITDERERNRLKQIVSKHLPSEGGFIVRTACSGRSEDEIVPEIKFLQKTWQEILQRAERTQAPALVFEDLGLVYRIIRDIFTDEVDRMVIEGKPLYDQVLRYLDESLPHLRSRVVLYDRDQPAFEHYGIEPELRRAMSRRIWLKSGGHIVIDETEALVAIDVNTGRFVGSADHEETIFQNNMEAAVEIARQLRLRDLGGIIVLDFIDMQNPTNRKHVLRKLEQEIRKDRARTNILQFTELGIVEMTRQRTKESLSATLCSPCPYCNGDGRILSEQTVVIQLLRALRRAAKGNRRGIRVLCSKRIAQRLQQEDRKKFRDLCRDLKLRVEVDSNPDLHIEDFRLYELPGNREIYAST